MNLVIHPTTEAKLASLRTDLPQSILLAGKPGVGLTAIARDLAGKDLANLIEPIDSKEEVNHETGTITVAIIRRLYDQTRAKTMNHRIIIVDSAERMSHGAQAAFLKLLEEPGEMTHFILTSHAPQALLATIRSRVQTVDVEPITLDQTKAFIDSLSNIDSRRRTQLEYLAEGLPAELYRLANDEEHFSERAGTMADTRVFLAGSLYQRLLIVHKYYQSKQKSLQLLEAALTVSRRSLSSKPQGTLIGQLERLVITKEKIEANCNIRLQLMAFVIY